MFLLNPEPGKITVADLQALIDDHVIESRDIEYKRIVAIGPKADEKKKIKFLAGVSSFSNTDGGDFIVGLRAENGIPKEITPIERTRVDSLKLAIEQLTQTGISPRISLTVCEIPVTDTHSALLVRVEKSWAAPHRVTLAGDSDFYGMHSSGIGLRFERDDLIIEGLVVDSWDADRGVVFKPIFDILWNAGGYERCLDYKATGELDIDASHFQDEIVM